MKKTCLACETLARRAYRSFASDCLHAISCRIRVPALLGPTWTAITKWRTELRHRVAGNRMSMSEPRRRSARRNLMAGLIRYDRIKTTEARAHAIRGETEKLISIAVKGRRAAQEYLASVVSDEEKATQILAFARRGRFSLDDRVYSNEERAEQGKPPLPDKGRRFLEKTLKDLPYQLLRIISKEDEAEEALQAAYEAMVIELRARRRILKSLPYELVFTKLFKQLAPHHPSRPAHTPPITT